MQRRQRMMGYHIGAQTLSFCLSISVYKHWRHFRSRAQNHWCVWLAKALFDLVKSFTHGRIRQVSILGFPLNLNSEASSWYSNFPAGFRMKSSIYVKRQSFEVRNANFQSFLLFWSLFANHKYCVIVFVTSLILRYTVSSFLSVESNRNLAS